MINMYTDELQLIIIKLLGQLLYSMLKGRQFRKIFSWFSFLFLSLISALSSFFPFFRKCAVETRDAILNGVIDSRAESLNIVSDSGE